MTNAEYYFKDRAAEAIQACKDSAEHWRRLKEDEWSGSPFRRFCACCNFEDRYHACPLIAFLTRGSKLSCDGCNHHDNPYMSARIEWGLARWTDDDNPDDAMRWCMEDTLRKAAKWLEAEHSPGSSTPTEPKV